MQRMTAKIEQAPMLVTNALWCKEGRLVRTPISLAQIIPRTKRQGLAVLETNMLGSLSGRLDTSFDIVKLYCLWYAVKATVGEGLSDQLLHSKN